MFAPHSTTAAERGSTRTTGWGGGYRSYHPGSSMKNKSASLPQDVKNRHTAGNAFISPSAIAKVGEKLKLYRQGGRGGRIEGFTMPYLYFHDSYGRHVKISQTLNSRQTAGQHDRDLHRAEKNAGEGLVMSGGRTRGRERAGIPERYADFVKILSGAMVRRGGHLLIPYCTWYISH